MYLHHSAVAPDYSFKIANFCTLSTISGINNADVRFESYSFKSAKNNVSTLNMFIWKQSHCMDTVRIGNISPSSSCQQEMPYLGSVSLIISYTLALLLTKVNFGGSSCDSDKVKQFLNEIQLNMVSMHECHIFISLLKNNLTIYTIIFVLYLFWEKYDLWCCILCMHPHKTPIFKILDAHPLWHDWRWAKQNITLFILILR